MNLKKMRQQVIDEAGAGYDPETMQYAQDETISALADQLLNDGDRHVEKAILTLMDIRDRNMSNEAELQALAKASKLINRALSLIEIGHRLYNDPLEDNKKSPEATTLTGLKSIA